MKKRRIVKSGWKQGKSAVFFVASKEKPKKYGEPERCPMLGSIVVGSRVNQNKNYLKKIFND